MLIVTIRDCDDVQNWVSQVSRLDSNLNKKHQVLGQLSLELMVESQGRS